MFKKFVPLTASKIHTDDPYEIETYKARSYENVKAPLTADPCCFSKKDRCAKKPIKVDHVTIEEEIYKFYEKRLNAPYEDLMCDAKCKPMDKFTVCVVPQRTPSQLKIHATARENYLRTQKKLKTITHDAMPELPQETKSLVEMESPMTNGAGTTKPKIASPACSLNAVYVPSRKMLEMKSPRSGIFINEPKITEPTDIPYDTYNPRMLQQQIEDQNWNKFNLYPNEKGHYTWYEGNSFCDNDCCCLYFKGQDYKEAQTLNDCINFEPTFFKIPKDTHKTFKGEVLFGNGALQPHSLQTSNRCPKEIACLYTAFAESFTIHPDYWTAAELDEIIQLGDDLHQKSIEKEYTDPKCDFDIIPEIEAKSTAIEIVRHFGGTLCDEPNILQTLYLFFRKYQAGVFVMDDTYLLIWKRCSKSYYIFDPNGRNPNCDRDHIDGKCSLIATCPIEHVVHVIMYLNCLSCEEDFRLYEIRLKSFGSIQNPLSFRTTKRKNLYAVVHHHYALIPGTIGVPPPEDSDVENASMMIAYIALVYNQIDPPKHWTMPIVDSLIRYGAQRYADFLKQKNLDRLDIWDLPDVFILGTFRATIKKFAFLQNGQVNECLSYRNSPLIEVVREFFKTHNMGLLKIDSSIIALWRDFRFYYVFDPFQRGLSGQAVQNPDEGNGVGCLQMHITLDSLLRILYKNSLEMRRAGNFFLHAIKIECVQLLSANQHLMDSDFEALNVKYPFPCKDLLKKYSCSNLHEPKQYGDIVPFDCLSVLSEAPCERVCSESDFLEREHKEKARHRKLENVQRLYSIQTIPERDRTPPYDTIDIVDGVIAEFMCRLMTKIKQRTDKRVRTSIEASKILLKSDTGHLKEMKQKLKRGEDYDNICVAFRTKPETRGKEMSLEEELQIPSNFIAIPDGSWGVFGAKEFVLSEDSYFTGVLSAIVAIVLTRRYKISTWNSSLVDFTLDGSEVLLTELHPNRHIISFLMKRQLPRIQLGSQTFQAQVRSTVNGKMGGFKATLKHLLTKSGMVLVAFTAFACAVFRRYNFYYLYMGYPCDVVGYRTSASGTPCLLRFVDFDTMVRRIDFGRFNDCTHENFVLINFHVKDVTKDQPDRFLIRTPSDEQDAYEKEVALQSKQKQRLEEKLIFIDDELTKEHERLKSFGKLKEEYTRNKSKAEGKEPSTAVDKEADYDEEVAEEEGEEELEDEEATTFKHTPGKELSRLGAEQFDIKRDDREFGYLLRDKDCHFKVQGTAFLDDRNVVSTKTVKPCFFAGVYAILNAIMCPLNRWDFRRMDRVIESAKDLCLRVKRRTNMRERTIKNVLVGNYIFQILVCAYEQCVPSSATIEDYIRIICQSRKYFMIQIPNGTFAVYKDDYYHLFDPYRTLEDKVEEHNEEAYCPPEFTKHPDKNTASWVLFSTIDDMLNYIDERAVERKWRDMYKLHVLNILSFKKATKEELLAYSLTLECHENDKDTMEDISCLTPEHVKWLEIYPNIVSWSRLKRGNIINQPRGSPPAMDRSYDVEIPNQLFSLWGAIHPKAAVFKRSRGKQYLAVNVIACCMANSFRLTEWNRQVLNTIVVHGTKYFDESTGDITSKDYEVSLENLNTNYEMDFLLFNIHLESVVYGSLYNTRKNEFNLSTALSYFFSYHRYGVIQTMNRSLAIGRANKGYFMFDCQSQGFPLFAKHQGAAYVLRSNTLQTLLYCIVMTLNIPYYNIQFVIHKVDVNTQKLDDGGEERQQGGQEEMQEE